MGDLIAAYKVADMYKNGYYVEKDYEKYKLIIKGLYPKIMDAQRLDEPLPEIFTRLARIRVEEGNAKDALRLYDTAKEFLAERIQCHPFFGDLNIMKWMIEDIYKLREFAPLTMSSRKQSWTENCLLCAMRNYTILRCYDGSYKKFRFQVYRI